MVARNRRNAGGIDNGVRVAILPYGRTLGQSTYRRGVKAPTDGGTGTPCARAPVRTPARHAPAYMRARARTTAPAREGASRHFRAGIPGVRAFRFLMIWK